MREWRVVATATVNRQWGRAASPCATGELAIHGASAQLATSEILPQGCLPVHLFDKLASFRIDGSASGKWLLPQP